MIDQNQIQNQNNVNPNQPNQIGSMINGVFNQNINNTNLNQNININTQNQNITILNDNPNNIINNNLAEVINDPVIFPNPNNINNLQEVARREQEKLLTKKTNSTSKNSFQPRKNIYLLK